MAQGYKKPFRSSLFGYSKKEVDWFAQEKSMQSCACNNRVLELESKCAALEKQISQLKDMEMEISRAIIYATRVSADLIQDAKIKSMNMLTKTEQEIKEKLEICDAKIYEKRKTMQVMEERIAQYREICRDSARQILDVLSVEVKENSKEFEIENKVVDFHEEKKLANGVSESI